MCEEYIFAIFKTRLSTTQVLRNAMGVGEYGSAHISVTNVQRDGGGNTFPANKILRNT